MFYKHMTDRVENLAEFLLDFKDLIQNITHLPKKNRAAQKREHSGSSIESSEPKIQNLHIH
jgi:hypothetical protein